MPHSYQVVLDYLNLIRTQLPKKLAEAGAPIHNTDIIPLTFKNKDVQTLVKAIESQDIRKMTELLRSVPRIAEVRNSHLSILALTINHGDLHMVNLVISRLPITYHYGLLLGDDNTKKQQSAVLMAALAGKPDILDYLLSDEIIFASIAQRDILFALKKIEHFLRGEMDEHALQREFGWSVSTEGKSEDECDEIRENYHEIYEFLNKLYFNELAKASSPACMKKGTSEMLIPSQRYYDSIIPGRGTFLFSPKPLCGTKRRLEALREKTEEEADNVSMPGLS